MSNDIKFSSSPLKTIGTVLRDRIEMEKLIRKIPQEHPSYNRALYVYHVEIFSLHKKFCFDYEMFFRIQIGEINCSFMELLNE